MWPRMCGRLAYEESDSAREVVVQLVAVGLSVTARLAMVAAEAWSAAVWVPRTVSRQ